MKRLLLSQITIRPVMHSGITKVLVTAIIALQLVACGGGGGDDAVSAISTDSPVTSQTTPAPSSSSDEKSTVPATSTGDVSTVPVTSSDDESTAPVSSTSGVSTVPVTSSDDESTAAETINTGSASLSWTAPVTRADGTPLSLADIGGYYIYYGESEGSYPNRVDLDDGTAQAVTLNDIPVGTYYMVMTTYDVNGRESSYSSVVEKTVL